MVPEETDQRTGRGDSKGEESLNRLRSAMGSSAATQGQVWVLVTDTLHGKHVKWTHAEGPGPSLTGKTTLGHVQGVWLEVKGTPL